MIQIVTKDRHSSGYLTLEEELALTSGKWTETLATLLGRLWALELWLQCACGVYYHIRDERIVVRTREQPQPPGTVCPLCAAHPAGPTDPSSGASGGDDYDDVPTMRTSRPRSDSKPSDGRRGTGRRTPRKSPLARLQRVLHEIGATSLTGTLAEDELWSSIALVLRRRRIPGSELHQSDLLWTPSQQETPTALLHRIALSWDIERRAAQVWSVGFVREPFECTESGAAFTISCMDADLPIVLSKRRFKYSGRTGPWIALAMGRLNAQGEVEYVHAGLQAIAALDRPVPVESGCEREAVFVFQDEAYSFCKPLPFHWAPERPDFILPRDYILVEVNGRRDRQYLERKHRVHDRVLQLPEYRGWGLIRWDATSKPVEWLRDCLRQRWHRKGVRHNNAGSWRRRD